MCSLKTVGVHIGPQPQQATLTWANRSRATEDSGPILQIRFQIIELHKPRFHIRMKALKTI